MLRLCCKPLVKVGTGKPRGFTTRHLIKPLSADRNFAQQSPVPKMPVPPLQHSCELYVSFLETFLKPEQLNHTKKLVEEFLRPGGVGEKLQRGLERKACDTENWSTDDFLNYDCLVKRKPLVVRLNFGILCTRKDVKDKQGQLRCAAEFIARVLELKMMADSGTLPVEYMRGKPLCMKQYEQVFSSCRIPRLEMDSLYYAKSSDSIKHISVVHNGQFFALDVYSSDGTLLTADQLCVQLEKICDSSMEASVEPVGILTTQRRDAWSKTYDGLMQDETNRESLSAIESSIFTLCLDGAMPPEPDEMMSCRSGLLQMFHGGGSQWYSGNRWFDKGLQIIVGEDGTRGVNCGHTIADGTVLMAICDYAVSSTNGTIPDVTPASTEPLPMPLKLHFNITPAIKRDIAEAKQQVDILIQNMDMTVTVFKHYGKNAIKAHNMSPDAFVQMAIQLAYYRVYKTCGATLEPVSLRMFTLGRVATIPSNSRASAAFVEAFDDPKEQNILKADLLEEAIKEHVKRTEMVLNGHAAGIHLVGLFFQARRENIPLPHLFTDPSFTKAFTFYNVTTSQVTSKTGGLVCNSFDHPGTYGVNYSIMDNHIDCRVASLEASGAYKEKNPKQLCLALEDALLDMMSLLEETSTTKPGRTFRPK